ncbi:MULTISPECIES: TraH family protein [Rhizobium/Agrobacterium group]|uniref:Conjugal transfer protein Dtr system n=2 Tax=Rhizobium/Agrobacterium group TaxID=227290 RepID=B9K3V8_ALLAM|nr:MULTISPECIES: TraH family protein [Rhizobium/Agrobacterium group]ACM39613.1 conjugal transfer protein Dtr system [Allorhizobium ampelinum S4]MCF1437061.1 conjugal transfer protein TraH [Allorhizobium ampelinum]MCF1450737.1 conjugal transfer protein TraH [Allorhizobium ampelinum]MCF1496372.1 conjugal transfer protein TraH [Allorhizobium ampelinum]MUO31768.1 conjugal transfer protein TraH [Agrobacterium vitis]
MVDAALIKQCADPALKPAIVEQFIARVGSQDPLAITVRSGSRVVLVPKPMTPEEALVLIRDNLGRNTVRVGITQYPAGLGIVEAGQLKPDLVDACENIRMGTALFAKVWRIVMKWYGNPTAADVLPQVMDDSIIAWQTGYFEGTAVFRAEDPGEGKISQPATIQSDEAEASARSRENPGDEAPSPEDVSSDPNKAGIRIDLSGIGARER